MIYLIESSGHNRTSDGKLEYFLLLKIGYTNDEGKNKRYSQYKLHNPTSIVFYMKYPLVQKIMNLGYSISSKIFYMRNMVENGLNIQKRL